MKILKNPVLIIISFLLFSCATINFNTSSANFYMEEAEENEPEQVFREFDLSYSRQIAGLKIEGKKSVVERVFSSPDDNTLFIVISFPKIAVLKTTDFGQTFQATFVANRYLEKIFGYDDSDSEDENQRKNERKKYEPARINSHVVFSGTNPDKIALTVGPFLFSTTDGGDSWEINTLFMDLERDHIRQILVLPDDTLLFFSNNRMAVSYDWGKTRVRKRLSLEGIPPYQVRFVRAFFDSPAERLYVSVKHKDESDGQLSLNAYNLLYKGSQEVYKSGLYYSDDMGKSWKARGIHVPLVLFEHKDVVYGATVYPLAFYNEEFSAGFKKGSLYKTGLFSDGNGRVVGELVKKLQDASGDALEILYKGAPVFSITREGFSTTALDDFEAVLKGKEEILDTEYIHFNPAKRGEKKDDFLFFYNPYRLFKIWTGQQTDGPVYYSRDSEGNYYRLRPALRYLKVFYKFAVYESVRIENKHPFLRKINDIEFFHPKLDPTGGFPVLLEKSTDQGETWIAVGDPVNMKKVIDPAGKKRSVIFWYKTVDIKKRLKLQFAFGNQESIDFHVYPSGLLFHQGNLLLLINYYTVNKSYKDLYILPPE